MAVRPAVLVGCQVPTLLMLGFLAYVRFHGAVTWSAHFGPAPPSSAAATAGAAAPAVARVDTSALVGRWRESAWTYCTPPVAITQEQTDPNIEELEFRRDGTFTVTWTPFESYRDYWGTWTHDAASGALALTIDRGNYVPADFAGTGTATLEGGRLVLHGIRLGSRLAKNRPAICELTFTRY
jgi:hypothetical protein